MRSLRRNKRVLYLCKQYIDGDIEKYHEPQEIMINWQYTNSESDLVALGLEYPMYIRIKTDLQHLGDFHTNDRVYIGIKPSEPFDVLCKDANYEVESEPMVSLNTIEVTLKKLSAQQ